MPDLKLAKLPDRTPVKYTIFVMPELEQKLRDYANLYRQSYSEAEPIQTLIPFMLDAFLQSDRAFAKARKDKLPPDNESRVDQIPHRKRAASLGTKISVSNEE